MAAITLDYCWQLVQEYSILQLSQIYVLLKRHGDLNGKARFRLVERLMGQWHIHQVLHAGEKYLTNQRSLLPKDRYRKQITCFWILLDYLPQADNHYATGTFSRISMEIDGKDYDIVYIEKGQERFCMAHMRKGGDTLFIVVVEDRLQIPLIKGDKIRAFAVVGEHGGVEYYTAKE